MQLFLCCQDVHNISHQYNIEGIKLHPNDHRSVSLWVESMAEQYNDNQIVTGLPELLKRRSCQKLRQTYKIVNSKTVFPSGLFMKNPVILYIRYPSSIEVPFARTNYFYYSLVRSACSAVFGILLLLQFDSNNYLS